MDKVLVSFAVAFLCCFNFVKTDYTAVVVEHNPTNESNANITIEENLKLYIYQIEKSKGANIIVFPEYGLTGLVIDPTNYSIEIPAVGSSNFTNYYLSSLSNAAIEHQMYVVINILEKSRNENNDTIYYNTNVVFDKTGAIAAKYRKINLFEEPNLTAGTQAVTFTTDFGITFGIFTCFDILFYHPSRSILENNTVGDVIVPQAWSSLLPFYMSLNVQSAYAIANRVNLLASNLNNPSLGMGGSGIYRKDGTTLRQYLSGSPSTVTITADIQNLIQPRDELDNFGFGIIEGASVGSSLSNYNTTKIFDFDSYVYKPLDLSQGNLSEEICDGSFCCTFNITVLSSEVNTSEVYKLLAFNGRQQFEKNHAQVKLCHLVACGSDDIQTCGDRPVRALSTKFREIVVSGTFEHHFDHFYTPSSLRGDLLPVTNVTYLEVKQNETVMVSLYTNKTEENVVVFGIYGRGRAGSFGISVALVAVLLVAQKLF